LTYFDKLIYLYIESCFIITRKRDMEIETDKYGKGLFFRIAPEIHIIIKTSASAKGLTIQKWILRAIMEQIKKEKMFE